MHLIKPFVIRAAGLHLEGLTLAPPGGGKPLTAALHASIGPGQSLLVVGPSGCGKSSLLRAIAGALCAVPRVLRDACRSVRNTSSGSTGPPGLHVRTDVHVLRGIG